MYICNLNILVQLLYSGSIVSLRKDLTAKVYYKYSMNCVTIIDKYQEPNYIKCTSVSLSQM